MKIKIIEKLDAGYTCICAGNSIYTIESKVNEIIDRLNGGDFINEVTLCCNKCGRPSIISIGKLIQHKTDYEYDCTCGHKPRYVGSEWKWTCTKCGARNF